MLRFRFSSILFTALLLCAMLCAGAQGLYYPRTAAEEGKDANRQEETRWRARMLDGAATPATLAEPEALDARLLHSSGGIANLQVAEGKISFDVTAPGRVWWGYAEAGRKRAEELTIGANWPKMLYALTLELHVKQSLPSSALDVAWVSARTDAWGSLGDKSSGAFTLQGADWQTARLTVPGALDHASVRAVVLDLKTPGNHVEIDLARCGHLETQRHFRTTLTLPAAPRSAVFNVVGGEFDFFVNGQPAYQYHYFKGGNLVQFVRCEKLFRAGKNTLALVAYRPGVALQGQVLLPDGRALRVQTDATWKTSAAPASDWMLPTFDDAAWSAPSARAEVHEPVYDGLIDLRPTPSRPAPPSAPNQCSDVPPIFNFAEGVRFAVNLPVQTANPQTEYTLHYRFNDAWTDELGAEGTLTAFRTVGPDKVATLTPRLPHPGVYNLRTEWLSHGQVLDTRVEEVMLVGPVAQPKVPESQAEATMALKLIDSIDCARDDTHPRLTYSGDYRKNPAVLFTMKPVTSAAGAYLESTTTDTGECLRYQVKIEHPFRWHIIEFSYPDDADRVMTFGYEDRLWNGSGGVMWPRGDGGVHTGYGLPVSNTMQTLRLPILPGKETGSIYVLNCKNGDKVAMSAIRVYEVTGDLPWVTSASEAPGRYFGTFDERPLSYYSFAAFPGWDRFTQSQLCTTDYGNYKRWYRTYENYIKYLHYSGRNAIFQSVYMYGDYSSNAWPAPDKGNDFWNSQEMDTIAPLLQLCEANDIGASLLFEFSSAYRLHGHGATDVTNTEVAAGLPTNGIVNKYGRQVAWWCGYQRNPLHPDTQRAMTYFLDDLLSRYARYTSVKSVGFLEGGAWGPAFPNEYNEPNGDWLVSGYDDFTVDLFSRETGVTIPVEATDKNRFSKRYDWLTKNAYETWVSWRCKKIKQVNDLLRDRVVKARPGLTYSAVFGEFGHSPLMELGHQYTGKSYLQLLRETGRDPRLYINQPGYVIYGELFAPDRVRSYTMHQQNIEDYGAGRTLFGSEEFAKLFANGANTGLFNGEYFYEQLSRLPKDVDWMFRDDGMGLYAMGSQDFARDRLTNALWHWNPSYMPFVWCDASTFMGNDENIRPFALAFRSLPQGDYTLLQGQGRDMNVAIKQLKGKSLWAVLNPGWWPLSVELTTSKAHVMLRDRVTGRNYPVENALTLTLRPFDVVVLESADTISITSAKATPSDGAVFTTLRARLAEVNATLTAALPSSKISPVLTTQLTAAVRKIDSALTAGDALTAWWTLESWEGRYPYLKVKEGLKK
ncbi:MAG TPA: hypothetical protein VGL77_07990 [Armatimonadota bacterium]|jgi:hypothetical protein